MDPRWAYIRRVAGECLRHPREALDRLEGRVRRALDGSVGPPFQAEPEAGLPRFHDEIGIGWPCRCTAGFQAHWDRITSSAGMVGHDADVTLASLVWAGAIHLRAERVIETGVARGVTTSCLLAATRSWDGRVWSVDLPPIYRGWEGGWAAFVSDADRARWTLVRGGSRRMLPRLVAEVGALDLAVCDSDHSASVVLRECMTLWPALKPNGVLIVDDVDKSAGFARSIEEARPARWLVADHARKGGMVGLVMKDPA